MPRLFVALRPPPAIRDRLLDLMIGVDGARWQDEEQLHLTLRFVGEIDARAADDLAAALGQVHAPVPIVRLAGTGRFEKRGRTNALWAGVQPHAQLAALHRKVDAACVRAGLPPEGRAYLPHITVARAGSGTDESAVGRWIGDTAGLASAPFACPHLILYESQLGHGGASYEPVLRWPLDPD